jgi:Fic family protein
MRNLYGVPFGFVPTAAVQGTLYRLDRTNVAKDIVAALGNKEIVGEYRVSQLIEEAISSSMIEGARPTTRDVAREMVLARRSPESRDERMIYNNWLAMQRIVRLVDEQRAITRDDLPELHRILGDGALEIDGAEGVFRGPEHRVEVADVEGNVWHVPPSAVGLPQRIDALLAFANAIADAPAHTPFIHPIVRAFIVHFWIGYEHPFRDGNGRIARALFYWCMLRSGYEMAQFLAISGPIDRSPSDYYLAFAHTEVEAGDLTYFILHQLRVIEEVLAELTTHIRERVERTRTLAQTMDGFAGLNRREMALLQHAVRHPRASYSIEGHGTSHGVHYQTARLDLLHLEKLGYLESRRTAAGKLFFPTLKLLS